MIVQRSSLWSGTGEVLIVFFFLDGTEPFLLNVVSIVKTSILFWKCFALNLSPDLKLRFEVALIILSRCLLVLPN